MFESLINLVKEHSEEAIVKNPAIPNEHNDEAINSTASGIMDQLKGLIQNGDMSKITDIFKGGDVSNNPELPGMSDNIGATLSKKFGIDPGLSANIMKSLIPVVMSQLVKKTNDPNDKSFDLGGILSSLTGGNSGGLGSILGNARNILGK